MKDSESPYYVLAHHYVTRLPLQRLNATAIRHLYWRRKEDDDAINAQPFDGLADTMTDQPRIPLLTSLLSIVALMYRNSLFFALL